MVLWLLDSVGWCRYKPDRQAFSGGDAAGPPDPFSSSSSDDARRAGTDSDGGSYSSTETESDEDEDWVTPQVSPYYLSLLQMISSNHRFHI